MIGIVVILGLGLITFQRISQSFPVSGKVSGELVVRVARDCFPLVPNALNSSVSDLRIPRWRKDFLEKRFLFHRSGIALSVANNTSICMILDTV